VPLGVTEVLFEANCYNNLYGAFLPKWGPMIAASLCLLFGILLPFCRTKS
jgi:hypothetical protein